MAWRRDEARLNSSSFTAYSYTEVDWEVHGDKCTYRHIGGITSPYNFGATATAEGEWWEGSWHSYRPAVTGSGTFGGYGDLALFDVTDTFARQAQDRVVSVGTSTSMMGASARSYIDYTVPHLAPSVTWASSNPVVRNSDNSITLTWNAPALEYSAMCLEVSIDGGAWSQFAVLWNTATSYTWTGCSAGHSYQFRIRTNYLASYSDYDVCATVIVNTPLPPESISTAATSGTNVTVTLVNTSPVATSCEYRLGDGTNWGAVVTGQDTQSFSVNMGSDHYIQVRNANATGTSNWLQSSYINTVTKPNKPTLWQPVDGSIVEPGDITFSWNYNSADGSEQTAWELEYTLGMQPTPTTVSSDASTATDKQTTITMNEGWEPYWRVRTKGASSSWSDWSSGRTLRVYSAPTVSIAAITATGMPISISATYSDTHQPYPMGTPITFDCVYAAVTLKSGDRTILTKPAIISGTSLTCDISLSDAILENGESYTIVLDVRSSSGLQASTNATFTTAFTEPQAGGLQITNDPETGYASLLATFDNHASDVEYSGDTNTQFDTTAGYVRSLTVQGKSEVQNGSLVSIEGAGVRGRNLADLTGISRTGQGLTFSADGSTVSITGSASQDWVPSTAIYLEAQPNTAYTISLSDKPSDLFNGMYISFWEVDASKANIVETLFATWATQHDVTEKTVTTRADTAYFKIAVGSRYSGTATGVSFNVQLELGSTAHAYEPYRLTTITTPLRSAGSIADELQVEGTDAQVARKVGVLTFDGTEANWTTWNSSAIVTGGKYYYINQSYSSEVADKNSSQILVSGGFLARASYTQLAPYPGSFYFDSAYYPSFLVSESDFPTLADFKTWLGTHPVTIYYQKKTPTTDTLPDVPLIELGTAATVTTDLDSTFSMVGWDGSADAVSISVARVNADGITPLIEDAASGAGAVDKYAPLNTPYQYAVTTKSSANAVKTVYVDNEIVTDLWFAYWTHKDGDTVTEMTASAKWNPDNGGIQIARPQKTRVYYAGRKDPVSYDGAAVSLTETPSWMVVDRSEIQPFVQLIEDGGRGVYKSCDGWVYHADFDLSLTPKYTAIGYYGGIRLSVTRIAGDQL